MFTITSLAVTTGALYLIYRGLSAYLSSFLHKNFTVLDELDNIGRPRTDGRKIGGTVVVAGGSLAGLWTARVCSDHFERVVVIDPEGWLNTEEGVINRRPEVKYVGQDRMRAPLNTRSRVFQYTSLHVFQIYGLMALRRCFPGWDEEYKSAGGLFRPQRLRMYYAGIPQKSFEHLLPERSKILHWCTRGFMETFIRRFVKKTCKNVDFITGTVVGVKADGMDGSKIASVSYQLRSDGAVHVQPAVLIVDCAGPSHHGLKWLAEAGYGNLADNAPTPANKLPLSNLVVSYHPKMNYSTSYWPLDAEQRDELERIIPGGFDSQSIHFTYASLPSKDHTGGGLSRFEDDRVQILCGGWGDISLPRNPEEIVEFYRGMKGLRPVPDWVFSALDVIFKSRDQAVYDNVRVPQCSRVLYGKGVNLPTNYVAIGDSSAQVNPVYAQGHSKSIMGAAILDSSLRTLASDLKALPSNFSSRFFEMQEKKVCAPMWDATKTQDYNYKTTTPVQGESLADGALIRWYSTKVSLVCTWDAQVAKTINDASQFTAPFLLVFKPSVVVKVLWEGLTGWAA